MKDCFLDFCPLKKYMVFILSLSLKSFILSWAWYKQLSQKPQWEGQSARGAVDETSVTRGVHETEDQNYTLPKGSHCLLASWPQACRR